MPIHTSNFETIEALIIQAPVLHLHDLVAFILSVIQVQNTLAQFCIRFKMVLDMSLHSIVQPCQMLLADIQAQNLNYVV